MAYEKRDNSGTLGRNDRKEKDTHPDHKGSAMIGGIDYWISAWIKTGPTGKFFSLAFTPKNDDRVRTRTGELPRTTSDIDSEDIPF